MITVFNRKRVFTTFDMAKQSEVTSALKRGGVDYYTRVINRMSSSPVSAGSRARTGTYGNDLTKMYEYIIYVNKKDFEKASFLINK